jgi:hypothetical protein
VLTAGTIGALLLAGAAACASSTTTATSSDSSSAPISAGSSPAASATASAGASASPSGAASGPGVSSPSPSTPAGAGTTTTTSTGPVIPGPGGIVVTPQAQVSTTPSGGKLIAFTSAAHSADGRTLYLGIESQGGACGQYDVVLQQTGDSVSAGLVHLSSGGRICPMYVTHMLVEAKLSAPLERRRVIDLANGQPVASAQVA